MNDKEIYQRITQIVAQKLSVEESQISPDANFVEDLGADSLDQVELVMALEEEFATDISDEDSQKITTVGDLIAYFTKYSQPQNV